MNLVHNKRWTWCTIRDEISFTKRVQYLHYATLWVDCLFVKKLIEFLNFLFLNRSLHFKLSNGNCEL